jgi:hypothetical protein
LGFDDGVSDDAGISDDAGVATGEAVPRSELVGVTASDDELVGALVDPGVEETGVLSWSSWAVGDVSADCAAAVGLVRWLVADEL